jgi:hypothetical protein
MIKRRKLPPGLKHPSEMTSQEELVLNTAMAMDMAATQYAHTIYWDKEFHKAAGLDGANQAEQDFTFNELIVGCIVLVMLSCEAPDLSVDDEMKDYFKKLRDVMPEAHAKYLQDMGVESKHLEEWKKLITMRFEEYARDRHGVRSAAMQLHTEERDLDLDNLAEIQFMVPLQAVAFGTHHHICRGKTDGKDDVLKRLLSMLSKFYTHLRLNMLGRKLTPSQRFRVAIRSAMHRLSRRLGLRRRGG